MAETFKLELVSPERLLLSEDVEHVVVPGAEGDFGVMANHAPVLSSLRPGILEIVGDKGKRIFIRGGLAEAGPDSLTILAQQAIEVDKLDAAMLDQEIDAVKSELETVKEEVQLANINLTLNQLQDLKSQLGL